MATAGELTFSNRALSDIASRSLLEVPGVRGTSADLMAGLIGRISRGSTHKGIVIRDSGSGKVMDISIVVAYGSKMFDICSAVQRQVAEMVKTMTGLEVTVNIKVARID